MRRRIDPTSRRVRSLILSPQLLRRITGTSVTVNRPALPGAPRFQFVRDHGHVLGEDSGVAKCGPALGECLEPIVVARLERLRVRSDGTDARPLIARIPRHTYHHLVRRVLLRRMQRDPRPPVAARQFGTTWVVLSF